jgi:hypothetical protein
MEICTILQELQNRNAVKKRNIIFHDIIFKIVDIFIGVVPLGSHRIGSDVSTHALHKI